MREKKFESCSEINSTSKVNPQAHVILWHVKIHILEVVNGMGMGGAEKGLVARLKHCPDFISTSVVNLNSRIDAITLSELKNIKVFTLKYLFKNIALLRILKEVNPNVVVVRTPRDLVRLAFISKFAKKPTWKLVFEAHSNVVTTKVLLKLPMKLLLHRMSSKVDLTIAISKNVSQGILCKKAKRIEIIYYGSDLEVPNSMYPNSLTPRLLFVGRLVAIKRPLWLLEQIKLLKELYSLPESFLMIVGSGPLQKRLVERISNLGLEREVKFFGFQEDVLPFMLSSTHLISPSLTEGLPITFYEAKLAGMRIITTPSGGGTEILDNEDILLNDFESDTFLRALGKVIESGGVTKNERLEISSRSFWMRSSHLIPTYYDAISKLVKES
jgi:glycosyltransferase involved in cell wall biosynthesis